jgi:hypothetical protein
MRINFRQGIVSHQTNFIQVSTGGVVSLLATDRPAIVTVAHKDANYTHSENRNVVPAQVEGNRQSPAEWAALGTNTEYWLYWDFSLLDFTRTFGFALVPPVYSPTEPTPSDLGSPPGTSIPVDQHWYDTTNHRHLVWDGQGWIEVLRVFVARIWGTTLHSVSATESSGQGKFTGTQIGDSSSIRSGRVLFSQSNIYDERRRESLKPVRRDDGVFLTTEDQMFSSASRVDGTRLESNVAHAEFPESAVAAHTIVAWFEPGRARIANYNDVGETVVGILTEDMSGWGSVGGIVIQGVVTNPNWSWEDKDTGKPLWVENGNLVLVDPHSTKPSTYRTARVPVARVLSHDTVIFDQGLGGRGPRGPKGAASDLATTEDLGVAALSVPPLDDTFPIVVGTNDSRLTANLAQGTRTETTVQVTSSTGTNAILDIATTLLAGVMSATDKSKLDGIDLSTKVDKTGDIMTGPLTLDVGGSPAYPYDPLHAVTKQYVDSISLAPVDSTMTVQSYDLGHHIFGGPPINTVVLKFVAPRKFILSDYGHQVSHDIVGSPVSERGDLNVSVNDISIGILSVYGDGQSSFDLEGIHTINPGDVIKIITSGTEIVGVEDISISLRGFIEPPIPEGELTVSFGQATYEMDVLGSPFLAVKLSEIGTGAEVNGSYTHLEWAVTAVSTDEGITWYPLNDLDHGLPYNIGLQLTSDVGLPAETAHQLTDESKYAITEDVDPAFESLTVDSAWYRIRLTAFGAAGVSSATTVLKF